MHAAYSSPYGEGDLDEKHPPDRDISGQIPPDRDPFGQRPKTETPRQRPHILDSYLSTGQRPLL